MTKFLNISTDNTLGGNSPSDVTVSSQKAVKEYVDSHGGGGTAPVWGNITGTLSNQTDLQNALNAKYDASNPNGYTSNVGTVTSVNNTSPDSNGNVALSIPTVNNATLTITQGGTTKGTFTANAGTDVTIALDAGGGSVDVDNKSITTNASSQIQTVGVINSRDSSTAVKTWTGTRAQYNAITTKDANTLYNITDDTTISLSILEAIYPVGSVYITTASTCPMSSLITGSTWTLLSTGIVKSGEVPIKGNGKVIGLTNGTTNYGLNGSGYLYAKDTEYNKNVSTTTISSNNVSGHIGLTFDSSKSGMVLDTTSFTLTVNIYERTA